MCLPLRPGPPRRKLRLTHPERSHPRQPATSQVPFPSFQILKQTSIMPMHALERGTFTHRRQRNDWVGQLAGRKTARARRTKKSGSSRGRAYRERSSRGKTSTGSSRSKTGTHYLDRKSTRLNSSHSQISYALFFFK